MMSHINPSHKLLLINHHNCRKFINTTPIQRTPHRQSALLTALWYCVHKANANQYLYTWYPHTANSVIVILDCGMKNCSLFTTPITLAWTCKHVLQLMYAYVTNERIVGMFLSTVTYCKVSGNQFLLFTSLQVSFYKLLMYSNSSRRVNF